jgi:hypothetical protein
MWEECEWKETYMREKRMYHGQWPWHIVWKNKPFSTKWAVKQQFNIRVTEAAHKSLTGTRKFFLVPCTCLIGRGFCSDQNQKIKVLKRVANRWRAVVLSFEAGVNKSLIRDRNPSHNGWWVWRPYENPLYCLVRRNMVLRVSVCRVPMVVYPENFITKNLIVEKWRNI